MRDGLRTFWAFALSFALLFAPFAGAAESSGKDPSSVPLSEHLKKSYLELFELSPKLAASTSEIERTRKSLERAEKSCVKRFQQRAKDHEQKLREVQKRLRRRTGELSEAARNELHCEIQNLRVLKSQDEVLAGHAVPTAYENKQAKLDLIEKWPAELEKIKREIEEGKHHGRRFGDVHDIGFREIAPGQEEDVKRGQEAIRQMKMTGMMPPEVENETVQNYVRDLTERIARHSDLRVPAKVAVLNSKEINAFALPGGFLFIQRGLLEAAEDESQLAGVVAHEIAHAAGRHGHKLMKKATISGIIYQAAQVAAIVLTGGVASIGAYYALQYGFYGLGLVLSLDLLGVSRQFELEADQLGVQYAWSAGYDPRGFIRFFDKMATTAGYVNGLSWFRTHPPFYERMVHSQREIMYLPEKEDLIVSSPAFDEMKKELEKVTAAAEEEEEGRPSLRAPEADCPPPDKIEYEDGQPIETICGFEASSSFDRR